MVSLLWHDGNIGNRNPHPIMPIIRPLRLVGVFIGLGFHHILSIRLCPSMPMGRQQSKFAMYNQVFHERPIPEGMIARMPEGAYDYIESNLLLRDMSNIDTIQIASDDPIANWDNEIDELLDVGFRYVVVHRLEDTGTWILTVYRYQERMFFMEIEPDFETDTVAVYDFEKLRGHPPQGDPFAED